MITNEERELLIKERDSLKLELLKLKKDKFSIVKEFNQNVPSSVTARILVIEQRLSEIKQLVREAHVALDHNLEVNYALIKETFGISFFTQFKAELKRRLKNEPAVRLSINIEESNRCLEENRRLKKLLVENNNKITNIRKALNNYINKNITDINKGEFLKNISELNRSVPSLSDIESERVKQHY